MTKRLLLLIGFTGSLFAMEPEITDQKGKEKVHSCVQEIILEKEAKYIITSPQGNFAFVHYKDDSGALLNVQTGKQMRTFKKLSQVYKAYARFSSDEKLVSLNGVHADIAIDGRVSKGFHWLLLNLTSDHGKIVEAKKEYPVMDHQFSPNGNSLMLSLVDNNKKVFYKFNNNGIQFNSLVLELRRTESFSFSPDGDFLYLTQMEDQPKSHLFHLASSNIIDLEEFEGDVHGAFTQNNKLQVVQAGKLRIIDPNDYEAIKVFNAAYPKRTKQDQCKRVNKPEECQKCSQLSQLQKEKTGLETQLASLQQKCKESQQKNMTKAKRGLIKSVLSFVGSGCVTVFGAWNWLKGAQENKTQNVMLTGLGAGLTVASGYRTIQNLIDYKNAQKH